MKILRRLIPFARPIHHFLPEYVIYTLLGIVFGLVNFAMLIPIMNTLFGAEKPVAVEQMPSFSFSIKYFTSLFNYYFFLIADTKGKIYALGFVCGIVALSTMLANVFRYLSSRVLVRLRLNVLEKIRNQLYNKLIRQSLSYYHNLRKGDLISVMMGEVQEMESSIISSVQVWLREPFIIIIYFIVLFSISFKLTLFTIIFLPLSGLIISFITKKLKKIGFFSQELMGKILSFVDESITGIKVVQSFSAEDHMQEQFAQINRSFSKTSKKLFAKRELTAPISEMLGVIVVVTLIMYGGSLLLTNESELTGAQFIFYLALYSQVIQPLKILSNSTASIQRGIVAAEKIFSILDAEEKIINNNQANAKTSFDKSIEVKNIVFKYDSKDVIKKVSFTIEKGKTIALVGESGSGKSTLADMISRFYDPTEGQILIDGIDLRDVKLVDLRSMIAFVSQEAILFHETVKSNIAFAKNNAPVEEVKEAAKIANAHNFIEQMDEGYDSVIGDRGMKMRGGQRQRMTIARAIYKNAPILILDEATSALDTESERLVQDAITNMMQNRTCLVIAHRLSTVRHADEIIVLQKGEIVEKGTHDELMIKNGFYKRLVDMQEVK